MPKQKQLLTDEEWDLCNELKDLRKNSGCLSNIGESVVLVSAMGCPDASLERKASCLMLLLKICLINRPLELEAIFAALGFYQGYETIPTVEERRKKYYRTAFPSGDLTNPNSTFQKREDKIIEYLAVRIAAVHDWPALLQEAPHNIVYPLPAFSSTPLAKRSDEPQIERTPFVQYVDKELRLWAVQFEIDANTDTPPFCDRKNEFDQIDSFCNDARPVLWWEIVGGRSVGKTRLAYEYAKTHNNEEWATLLVRYELLTAGEDHSQYMQFHNWNYPKNLLMIVDNAQIGCTQILLWIKDIYTKSLININEAAYKTRILLVEDIYQYRVYEVSTDIETRQSCYNKNPLKVQDIAAKELTAYARLFFEQKGVEIEDNTIERVIRKLRRNGEMDSMGEFIKLLTEIVKKVNEPPQRKKIAATKTIRRKAPTQMVDYPTPPLKDVLSYQIKRPAK